MPTLSGTVAGVGSLNIGGKEGFDVFNTDGGATFSYNGTEEVLTISRSGYVLIRGRNKDKAVGCGIVIEQSASIRLTLEDLNIKADKAFVPLNVPLFVKAPLLVRVPLLTRVMPSAMVKVWPSAIVTSAQSGISALLSNVTSPTRNIPDHTRWHHPCQRRGRCTRYRCKRS